MKWRFVDLDKVDNVIGAAIFEAIMKARGRDLVDDTVLFWRPSKPAVYIGYHQRAYEDLYVDVCRRMNIPIVRRILGGGTGYCDENQLIYNIIFKENTELPYGPRNVYRFVLGGVAEALHILGIGDVDVDEERFSVYANGRKISGSGQLTSNGVVNSSGSFLIDFNFKAMNKLLRDPVKNLRKGIEKPEDGMTSLKREVGGVSVDEAKKALRQGFEKILGRSCDGGLIPYERDLAGRLRGKYLEDDWIFRADMREARRKMSVRG